MNNQSAKKLGELRGRKKSKAKHILNFQQEKYVTLLKKIHRMEHNFNKYNLVAGQTVVLDGRYKVILLSLTKPNGMFSSVYSLDGNPSDAWDTMTNRLTPVQEKSKEKTDLELVYDKLKKRLEWFQVFDGLSDFEKGRIDELNNTLKTIQEVLLKTHKK